MPPTHATDALTRASISARVVLACMHTRTWFVPICTNYRLIGRTLRPCAKEQKGRGCGVSKQHGRCWRLRHRWWLEEAGKERMFAGIDDPARAARRYSFSVVPSSRSRKEYGARMILALLSESYISEGAHNQENIPNHCVRAQYGT